MLIYYYDFSKQVKLVGDNEKVSMHGMNIILMEDLTYINGVAFFRRKTRSILIYKEYVYNKIIMKATCGVRIK